MALKTPVFFSIKLFMLLGKFKEKVFSDLLFCEGVDLRVSINWGFARRFVLWFQGLCLLRNGWGSISRNFWPLVKGWIWVGLSRISLRGFYSKIWKTWLELEKFFFSIFRIFWRNGDNSLLRNLADKKFTRNKFELER